MYARNPFVSQEKVNAKWACRGKTKDVIIVVNPTRNDATLTQPLVSTQWSKVYNYRIPDFPVLQGNFCATRTYA